MKREKIEKYLGKNVEITLFDDDIIKGEFHKTSEEQFNGNPIILNIENEILIEFRLDTNKQTIVIQTDLCEVIKLSPQIVGLLFMSCKYLNMKLDKVANSVNDEFLNKLEGKE